MDNSKFRVPVADLDELLARAPFWLDLRGARVFLTGGTGFFGTWLVESLLHADRKLGLGASVVVLTRDPAKARERFPGLAGDARLAFHRGDVRDFEFPSGDITHVLHAATEASAATDRDQPEIMREVIVSGTRRVLELARRAGAKRVLYVSSGAVYARRDAPVAEDDPSLSAPLTAPSAYAQGKREAEGLCLESGLELAIARPFAFVGPHLPFDAHYAVGNFLRDALRGGPVEVKGDGTAVRSYLYASDLALWLWTILLKGQSGRAYNVGSEKLVTTADLARLCAAAAGTGAQVRIGGKPQGRPADVYAPVTTRARTELGLTAAVTLEEALRRTAAWAKAS